MAQKPQDEKPSAFTKAELIAHAKNVFKTKPEIMAGALHGAPDQLTKAEAQARLDAFLSRPIQNAE